MLGVFKRIINTPSTSADEVEGILSGQVCALDYIIAEHGKDIDECHRQMNVILEIRDFHTSKRQAAEDLRAKLKKVLYA